ncbi:MAG: efflux RND transporter periplasmic adaptor subunit [Oceanospirillaceae bacterium]|nr:efflux RND transporter periplasmic adaptor subunit [Oceanospirillaceae bacterium]
MSIRLNQGHYIAIVISAAVIIWMVSGYLLKADPENPQAPVPQSSDSLFTVQTEEYSAKPITPEITINGHSMASQSALLSAETAGKVIAINKREGQSVKKGDVIIELDPQDKPERLEQTQSIVKQREIELDGIQKLINQGLQNETKLVEAKALLAAAKADARSLQVQLNATKIRAPFNGVLEGRKVELGAYVRAGDAIISVLNYNPFIITGEVPEKDLMQLQTGQKATGIINLQSYNGSLRYIASRATSSTRGFSVEMEVPNPSQRMAEGLTASIRINLPEASAIKISPALLNINKEGQMGLKYVDAQNTVQFAAITLIKAEADGVWISGLPDPVKLITVGQSFVSTGQKVAISNTTPEQVK